MKKKILLLIVVCIFVFSLFAGCGNADIENEDVKNDFKVPVEMKFDSGTLVLDNMYIQQEETEYGYSGWIIFEFDFSEMNEKDRYWFEKEYEFEVDDESDLSDSTFLHINNVYRSDIQSNGKKYVFSSIEECQEPIEKMNISIEMNIRNLENTSYFNDIEGKCSEFNVVNSIPNDINSIMTETIKRYVGAL